MPRRIPDYPDAFYIFNKIASWGSYVSCFSLIIFFLVLLDAFFWSDSTKKERITFGVSFLFSKFGKKYFPILWYETLVTKAIPKILGVTAGFQTVTFGRSHGFLILFFCIFFVVYISILITEIFKNDKKLYKKLDLLFLQNEITFGDFSYWKTFKKLYLETDVSPIKTSEYNGTRKYSNTSTKLGPIWNAIKTGAGQKLIGIGTKLGSSAAPKVAAKPVISITSSGISAAGTGTLAAMGTGGALIMTGGDQAIRYVVENSVNSVTQTNHQWPPFKMQSPADVWVYGSRK